MKRFTLEKTIIYRAEILAEDIHEVENKINTGETNSLDWRVNYHSPIKAISVCNDDVVKEIKNTDVIKFPKYIEGGLYLTWVSTDHKRATYKRPKLTGNWYGDVYYKNGRFMFQPIECIIEHEVKGITEEEFLSRNGGCYTLGELCSKDDKIIID